MLCKITSKSLIELDKKKVVITYDKKSSQDIRILHKTKHA